MAKKTISIHLKNGVYQDVIGIPDDVEVVITDVWTDEEIVLTSEDNM